MSAAIDYEALEEQVYRAGYIVTNIESYAQPMHDWTIVYKDTSKLAFGGRAFREFEEAVHYAAQQLELL